MNGWVFAVVIIPTVINLGISALRLWLDYKKSQKDEVWETVLRLMCAGKDDERDESNFEDLYTKLKAFKDSGYAIPENRLDPDSPRKKQ